LEQFLAYFRVVRVCQRQLGFLVTFWQPAVLSIGLYIVMCDMANKIALEAYWGHDFYLSGSRDVIGHVTI